MFKSKEVKRISEKFRNLPSLAPRPDKITRNRTGGLVGGLVFDPETGELLKEARIRMVAINHPEESKTFLGMFDDTLNNIKHLSVLVTDEHKAVDLLTKIGNELEELLNATETGEPVNPGTLATILVSAARQERKRWIANVAADIKAGIIYDDDDGRGHDEAYLNELIEKSIKD